MKRILSFFIVVAFFLSLPLVCFSGDLKIAYVNVFKVFNEYNKTKEYDEKLEVKRAAAEKELTARRGKIESIRSKLEVLKESKRKKEEGKLAEEVKSYREIERKAFVDIKKERDEKMKEIIEDINKIIKEYAAKHKFDLVINENAILYGNSAMDITSNILNLSNKQYKKK